MLELSYPVLRFPFLVSLLFLGLMLGISKTAAAEPLASNPSGGPIEITVTGVSLETSLSKLPASASIISGEELLNSGVDYFQNQIISLPNVNYAGGTNRSRYFQIRGVGELEQYEGAPNSSVALIVDDVDLTGVGAAFTLFDLEQLEIHRGPQPTRFGSSALAGSINIETANPTKDFSGQTLFSAGSDSLFSTGIALSDSLSDNVSVRLTAFGHRQNGFRDNVFLNEEDTNKREEFTGRAKVLIEPSDSSRFTLTLANVNINNGYDVFTILNGFETQSDRPGYDEEKLQLASFRGEIDLGSATNLTTVTSAYRSEVDYAFDGDWGNNPLWAPFDPYDFFSDTDRERTTLAQQIRLSGSTDRLLKGSRYLLGAFFQSLDEETMTTEFSDNLPFDLLNSDYRAQTFSTFGSFEVPLSESFRVLAGARLEERDTRYTDSRGNLFTPNDLLWGGNLTFQYNYTQKSLAYFTLSRGFRGGGFNTSPSLPDNRREFSPESLLNFELGTRFSLLGGDLRGSLATFVNLRRDQQVKLALQVDPSDPLSFAFLSDNAARGNSSGFELELDFTLSERAIIRSSGSLLHTEIDSADEAIVSLEGRDQSHAPNWQYFVEGEYFFTDSTSGRIGISGRDAFYFDDSHDQKSDAYHLLHASLFYYRSNWQLQFWGRNLTDEEYEVRGFFFGNEPPDFPNTEYVQLGDPMSFGLTWTYYLDNLLS
jgi:outer membrane receptor protein involved in Fe transport